MYISSGISRSDPKVNEKARNINNYLYNFCAGYQVDFISNINMDVPSIHRGTLLLSSKGNIVFTKIYEIV